MQTFSENSPHVVNFALRASGASQTDVAKALGKSVATVCSVVNGRGRSRKIEEYIGALTRLPLHQLWPQWYAADGGRIRRRKRYMRSTEVLARMQAVLAEREAA